MKILLINRGMQRDPANEAELNEADLYDADLYDADLYGNGLNEADLYDADLYGGGLNGAHTPRNMPPANMNRAPAIMNRAPANMKRAPANMNRAPANMKRAPANMNRAPANRTAPPASGWTFRSFISNPSMVLTTFQSYLSKKPTLEIDEKFRESMAGIVKVQNKGLDDLIEDYKDKPYFISLIRKGKLSSLKVRVQLLNLISSVIDYLYEYKKYQGQSTSSAKLIRATENVLEDILLYLVYIFERDNAIILIKNSLRAVGNTRRLSNTETTSRIPWLAKKYEIPYQFNETLNTILISNRDIANKLGLVPGQGVRETSRFPYLEGTNPDVSDKDLSLDDLKIAYEKYSRVAREIEGRKMAYIIDEPIFKNVTFVQQEKIEDVLDKISNNPPTKPNELNENIRNIAAVIAENELALAPAPAPAPALPSPTGALPASRKRKANARTLSPSKRPKTTRKNRKIQRKSRKQRKTRK